MAAISLVDGRKAVILKAAAHVFRKKGYHATRIQDIADAVGMQKGSLYYYISSKEDLLRGLVEGRLQDMICAAEAILGTRHSASRKLERIVEMHLRHFQEHRDIFGIFLHEDMELLNRSSETDIRALARRYDDLIESTLTEGVETGEFAADTDKRIVIKAIVGMCNGTYTWFQSNGRYPIEEIARIFAHLIVDGIRRTSDRPPEVPGHKPPPAP